MIGTKGHYILYNDDTFNCPECKYVHFVNDWNVYFVKDGDMFSMKCCNNNCKRKLIVYRQNGIMHVTTYKLDALVKKQNRLKSKNKNKPITPPAPIVQQQPPQQSQINYSYKHKRTMEKRINIAAHLKRYTDVHVEDKRALVKGLEQLIEEDRKALIERMRQQIAQLEKGEFPEPVAQPQTEAPVADDAPVADAVPENNIPDANDL